MPVNVFQLLLQVKIAISKQLRVIYLVVQENMFAAQVAGLFHGVGRTSQIKW